VRGATHGILPERRFLAELQEVYYRNTGMIISLQPPARAALPDFFPAAEKSRFCRLVQSCPEGLRRCLESDRRGLARASRAGSTCIYRCHAGLTDAVIPLVFQGTWLGSLYTGQVHTVRPTEAGLRRVLAGLAGLGLEEAALRDAFFEVKTVDAEQFRYNVKLLSLIANHITTLRGELSLQKEIVRTTRELQRRERENSRLEQELRELSISILEFSRQSDASVPTGIAEHARHDHIIARAQLFIRSNYQRDIDLRVVAKAVYLSPSYFSSLFKRVTGFSFSEYLSHVRLEEAKRLLRETDLPIKEIVPRIGFEEYNYFNRAFKRLAGVPPARYRRTAAS
jgi:AraC-like DNA-binding protein/ligand-binding sensor protein